MSLPCEKTQDHVLPVAPEGLYDGVPCGPLTSSLLTAPPHTTPATRVPTAPAHSLLLRELCICLCLDPLFLQTVMWAHASTPPGLAQTHPQGGSRPTHLSSTRTHSPFPFPALCCSTVRVTVWHMLPI